MVGASYLLSMDILQDYNIMAKKSALQKIEDHEKLCRIMIDKLLNK